MEQKQINSLSAYVDFVMKQRNDASLHVGNSSSMWFFRGQKSTQWAVLPSIFRNDRLSVERDVIEDAIRHNPFEFRNLSEFEVLTKLQHYGLGTRLLDITFNPFVALFFATDSHEEYIKGKNNQYTQRRHDGVVYYGFKPWHATSELSAMIASAIPFTNFNQDMTVEKFLLKLVEDRMITFKQKDYLAADNYCNFVEYIQNTIFVRSDQSNERLIRQSGAFLLPTALNIERTHDNIGECFITKSKCELKDMFVGSILIPEQYKSSIRNELDFFNVNESTLFPELEHQMTYIQNNSRATIGIIPDFKAIANSIDNDDTNLVITDDVPDVARILDDYLPQTDALSLQEIGENIQIETARIDWKRKESIRGVIHSHVTTRLKKICSPEETNRIANEVLAQLLAPSEKYTLPSGGD